MHHLFEKWKPFLCLQNTITLRKKLLFLAYIYMSKYKYFFKQHNLINVAFEVNITNPFCDFTKLLSSNTIMIKSRLIISVGVFLALLTCYICNGNMLRNSNYGLLYFCLYQMFWCLKCNFLSITSKIGDTNLGTSYTRISKLNSLI